MTGVSTPAYHWFELVMILGSSAILLVLFLDDLVCVMWCTVMFTVGLRALFVGLCLISLLRGDKRVYEKKRI